MTLTASILVERSVRDSETGCLRWQGAHNPKGYGQVRIAGTLENVHRVAYRLAHGAIPDDHEIDHVWDRGCRYRDCIEPTHLEAVTHAENIRRRLERITHCPRGHEYSPENTYVGGYNLGREYPSRQCRECKNSQLKEPRQCQHCGKFISRRNLSAHMRRKHG